MENKMEKKTVKSYEEMAEALIADKQNNKELIKDIVETNFTAFKSAALTIIGNTEGERKQINEEVEDRICRIYSAINEMFNIDFDMKKEDLFNNFIKLVSSKMIEG